MGVDPEDVILLDKWILGDKDTSLPSKHEIELVSENGENELQWVYAYQLKSEEGIVDPAIAMLQPSTRAVDPGNTGDYSYYYIKYWSKNHNAEYLYDSASNSGFANFLDNSLSTFLGEYTPEWIWIPYTFLGITPSDFMPDYVSGDQLYIIRSESITNKVYRGYCSRAGREMDLVKVQKYKVIANVIYSAYSHRTNEIETGSAKYTDYAYSDHYTDYAWISQQLGYLSELLNPYIVTDYVEED